MNTPLTDLQSQGTESTPSITCSVTSGLVEISGRSLLNDSETVFSSVSIWLDAYLKEKSVIKFKFNFDYINSSSNYHLLSLLKKTCNSHSVHVTIDWYYEDEDIHDIGRDYKELLPELLFNFHEVK